MEDFDPSALQQLIQEALAAEDSSRSESSTTVSSRIPFALGDTRLLERLEPLLSQHLDRGDVTWILDDLRRELKDGLALGELRELHSVVKNCRKCPAMKPEPHLPSWNRVDPDVVFVAESPFSNSDADQFLIDSLKEAGFTSRRILHTSITRCFTQERRGPNDEEIATCSTRFLFTELQMLAPKLIVTLGSNPSSVLLGDIKITQDRGQTYWIGPWAILPTHSPAYVVRGNGERDFKTDLAQAYSFVYGGQK